MKGYQAGIDKLTGADSVVLGISVDTRRRNADFAKSLGLNFPLLSDEDLKVSELYGVLSPDTKLATRSTFVIDKQGVIQHIEQGNSAVDPNGAITMCSMLKQKETPK